MPVDNTKKQGRNFAIGVFGLFLAASIVLLGTNTISLKYFLISLFIIIVSIIFGTIIKTT